MRRRDRTVKRSVHFGTVEWCRNIEINDPGTDTGILCNCMCRDRMT